jgi:hypothetical protein
LWCWRHGGTGRAAKKRRTKEPPIPRSNETAGRSNDTTRRDDAHERLAVGPDLRDDLAELRLEAHVEHSVGLVEHEVRHAPQVHHARLEVVDQPAGRCDHDLDAALEVADLLPLRHAAVDARVLDRRRRAELVALALDLHRELARRREDQHDRPVARVEVRLRRAGGRRGHRKERARGRAGGTARHAAGTRQYRHKQPPGGMGPVPVSDQGTHLCR